jgi:hypothetical protein
MSAIPMIVKTSALPGTQRLNLTVHISADVLTPEAARRRANGWLLDNVGNLLLAAEPELVVGDRIVWRAPVILTSPSRGHIGTLGTLDLDAVSGEVLADQSTIDQFHARASELAQS